MARDPSRYDDAQGQEPLMHALTEPMQGDRVSGKGLSLGLRLLLYMLRGLRVVVAGGGISCHQLVS